MLLAFVPARGGSKGIPRKNLAMLGGKPLIHHTLDAARSSSFVDEIFLSTDDEEIASAAAQCGISTGYRRPAHLASDTASMTDTVIHGLRWFEQSRGVLPDEVLLLQPTSPLRTSADIDSAVGQFRSSGGDTLVSVHPMVEHPYECVAAADHGWSYLVQPPAGLVRRQDYSNAYYFINGAIYLARTRHVLGRGCFVEPGKTQLFEMPIERGLDIDSEFQLVVAESLLRRRVDGR